MERSKAFALLGLGVMVAFAMGFSAQASILDGQTGPYSAENRVQYDTVALTGPEALMAAGSLAGTNLGSEGTFYASAPFSVQYGGLATMCYRFFWGDGTDTPIEQPALPYRTAKASHTYAVPGIYHVYVTAASAGSGQSCSYGGYLSAPFVVNVGAPPTAL